MSCADNAGQHGTAARIFSMMTFTLSCSSLSRLTGVSLSDCYDEPPFVGRRGAVVALPLLLVRRMTRTALRAAPPRLCGPAANAAERYCILNSLTTLHWSHAQTTAAGSHH